MHIQMCRTPFPGLRLVVNDSHRGNDEVVLHWTATSRRQFYPFAGEPRTTLARPTGHGKKLYPKTTAGSARLVYR